MHDQPIPMDYPLTMDELNRMKAMLFLVGVVGGGILTIMAFRWISLQWVFSVMEIIGGILIVKIYLLQGNLPPVPDHSAAISTSRICGD